MAFGRLGLDFIKKHGFIRCSARTYHIFAHYLAYWNMPAGEVCSYYQNAVDLGYQSGDSVFISWPLAHRDYINPSLKGMEILERQKQALAEVKAYQVRNAENTLLLRIANIASLLGLTSDRASLTTDFITEACLKIRMEEGAYLPGIGGFLLIKMKLAYIYQDYESAAFYFKSLNDYKDTVRGYYMFHEYTVYSFLVITALYPRMSPWEKFIYRRQLKKCFNRVSKWAGNCPEAFGFHRWLMEAERHRIQDRPGPALEAYDRAIEEARINGYLFQEALCSDVTARGLLFFGQKDKAIQYVKGARFLYEQWGAAGKLKQMDQGSEIWSPTAITMLL